MAIPNAMFVKLAEEGINVASDFAELEESKIKLIADSLKRPGGRITDPKDPTATISTPPFVFGVKSLQNQPQPLEEL